MRPTPVGKPVPTAFQVAPVVERYTVSPHAAAYHVVTPAALVTTTLGWIPVRRRTHDGLPPERTRSYNPLVVAATQCSRSAGSTAIWKNAKPAREGELVSLRQVSPPSSLRMGPIPR